MTTWKMAARAEKMNPSVLREILKVTDLPGIISLAGGLPSPKTFPIQAFADACAEVLHNDGQVSRAPGSVTGSAITQTQQITRSAPSAGVTGAP